MHALVAIFMSPVSSYWHSVAVRAFWDSLRAFDTTPRLLLLGLLGAIVTAALVLLIRGWAHFVEHLIANIAIAFGGAVVTWLLVYIWLFVRTPNVLQDEAAQRASENRRTQDQGATKSLTDQIASQQREIDALKNAPAKTITRVTPAQEPEKQCWIANHYGMPNSTIKGAMTATAVIVHCNHKVDAPFMVEVEFDRDFIPGALVLPNSGGLMGGSNGKQGRVYMGQINSPALLSDQLVVVTVYGETDQYPRALRASVKALN
jgi:hypothetical protein